jgi:hypothetical protein
MADADKAISSSVKDLLPESRRLTLRFGLSHTSGFGTSQLIHNSFKKDYTGRTRLSFPNLFTKLKDLIKTWSKTNRNYEFNPENVPIDVLKMAEDTIDKCHRTDKNRNLLLSKLAKISHMTLIKNESGVVRGFLTNIIARNPELFSASKSSSTTMIIKQSKIF